MTTDAPLRVGISACLLGEPVRFDGGHKRDRFLTDTFGAFVEWVPVCPEVESGMGTPRESMRLVRAPGGVRLIAIKSGLDMTEQLAGYARKRVAALAADDLSGFVLKKDSPSCGLARVKVYGGPAAPSRDGRGLFAQALVARYPHLPIEEEGRLSDPRLRENFVERVFGYWRLRRLFAGRWTVGDIVRFHTVHKLILLAHAPEAYRRLGRLVAHARALRRHDLQQRYTAGFMDALAVLATRQRQTNVLQHVAGYFKSQLDPASRAELASTIHNYRQGFVPLLVPLTLVRHHVRVLNVAYLADQLYLDPHPKELMLRTYV